MRYYVKYYNTLCNRDIIEGFNDIYDAQYCKDKYYGEFVNEKGEKIEW